ncbi:hypothetical protein [Hallella absiana]|uniref:hypothetical protein n=1 Tax=Hallella absiana TaxID=2925336 RepID=UPI0021C792A3|nr:hypothetical protein [Hallella absiana]
MFAACQEDEGTDPGHDSTPVASVYKYTAGDGYNADNDCRFRVITNSAVQEVYYLAQLNDEKKALNMTDQQYADYVVEKGTKLDLKAASDTDVYVKDLHGLYDITVVAVRGNTKTQQTIQFAGLDYKPYGQGTWTSSFFGGSWKVDVEYSTVGNRYRIKSLYKDGYGFSFSPNGSNVTVYPSGAIETGYVHSSYGMVSMTDQGSTYDASTKTFTFNFKFTVSAGSFGTKTETLTLDK